MFLSLHLVLLHWNFIWMLQIWPLKISSTSYSLSIVINENNLLFQKQPLISLAEFQSSGPSISALYTTAGPIQLSSNGTYTFTIPASNPNFATVITKNLTASQTDCDLKAKTLVCLRLRGNIGYANDQEKVQISITRNSGQQDILHLIHPLTPPTEWTSNQ